MTCPEKVPCADRDTSTAARTSIRAHPAGPRSALGNYGSGAVPDRRVDAPHRLGKDALLRDNPPDVVDLRVATQVDERRHRNLDDPFVHDVLRELRTVTDSYPRTVLVGEVGIHHRARRLRYYESGDELQLAFDFGFWAKSVGCAGVPR